MEPTYETPPPAGPPAARSNKGTIALVLGIVGLICCPFVAPVAWIMGSQELKAIQAGQSAGEETMAKVGMILGIVGTVIFALWLIYVFVFGGLAVLQGLMGA